MISKIHKNFFFAKKICSIEELIGQHEKDMEIKSEMTNRSKMIMNESHELKNS